LGDADEEMMGDLVQEVYLKAYQSVAEASNGYGHYAI